MLSPLDYHLNNEACKQTLQPLPTPPPDHRQRHLLEMPNEILMLIVDQLDLQSVLSVSTVSRRLLMVAEECMRWSHPLARLLKLKQCCIIRFKQWNQSLLQREDVRRLWYRSLSKRKKHIPMELQGDLRLILSSLIAQMCVQTDLSCQTSAMYRTLSIFIGMPRSPTAVFNKLNEASLLRMMHTRNTLVENQALLPSLIRSLMWIVKEKRNQHTAIEEVTVMLLNLPRLIHSTLAEDDPALYKEQLSIGQRLVRFVSDEARSLRDQLLQEPIQQQAVALNDLPFIGDGRNGDRVNVRQVEPAARQRRIVQLAERNNMQAVGGDAILQPVGGDDEEVDSDNDEDDGDADDNAQRLQEHVQNVQFNQRAQYPIRIAVYMCIHSAALWPRAFNALTLATMIKNAYAMRYTWPSVTVAQIDALIYKIGEPLCRDLLADGYEWRLDARRLRLTQMQQVFQQEADNPHCVHTRRVFAHMCAMLAQVRKKQDV